MSTCINFPTGVTMIDPYKLPVIIATAALFTLNSPLGAHLLLSPDLGSGHVVCCLFEVNRDHTILLADLTKLLDHLFRPLKVFGIYDRIA